MLMRVTQNGNDYTLTSSVYMETWDYWYNNDGSEKYGWPGGDTPLWDTKAPDAEKRRMYTIRARSDGTVARIDIAFPKQADDANNIFNVENTPGSILWDNFQSQYVNGNCGIQDEAKLKIQVDQMFNSAFFTKDTFLGFYYFDENNDEKLCNYRGVANIYCNTSNNNDIYYSYDNFWFNYDTNNQKWDFSSEPNDYYLWGTVSIFEQASGIPPIMQTLYNSLDTSTIQPYTPTQVMELDITFP